VVEPGDDFAVLVGVLHGDVGHESVGGGAVPVLCAGFDVDDVAGADLSDTAGAGGDESVTYSVWPLGWWCQAVRAPGAKRTWAPPMADRSSGLRIVSTNTVPVNDDAGPAPVVPWLRVYLMRLLRWSSAVDVRLRVQRCERVLL